MNRKIHHVICDTFIKFAMRKPVHTYILQENNLQHIISHYLQHFFPLLLFITNKLKSTKYYIIVLCQSH